MIAVFPQEIPKAIGSDKITDILIQENTRKPSWHEVMINANIDILRCLIQKHFKHTLTFD
jgi:hypothetical protein